MILVLPRCYLVREEQRKMMNRFAVGIVLTKKIGDAVQEGEPLAIIHSNTENVEQSVALIQKHIIIGEEAVKSPPYWRNDYGLIES